MNMSRCRYRYSEKCPIPTTDAYTIGASKTEDLRRKLFK